MQTVNEIAVVSVVKWNGDSDKNGNAPVLLKVIAGKIPNRSILSGTIAESLGFELNKSYMIQTMEKESNEFGRQFNFTNLGEINGVELIKASKELGSGEIIEIEPQAEPIKLAESKTSKVKEVAY